MALHQCSVPLLIHPPESPYYGLSLEEQARLAGRRRGGGRPPREFTRKLRKASKEDMKAMALYATNALVHREGSNGSSRYERVKVVVKLPFNYRKRWPKSFPRGRIVAYEDWHIYVEIRAQFLVDFACEMGYIDYDSRTLQKHLVDFNNLLKEKEEDDDFLFVLKYATDACIVDNIMEMLHTLNSSGDSTEEE